jgi:hypothetical protein
MIILNDNQSCISLSKNLIFYAHTKHVEIQHHFVCKKSGDLNLVFCGIHNMVSNVLSKV